MKYCTDITVPPTTNFPGGKTEANRHYGYPVSSGSGCPTAFCIQKPHLLHVNMNNGANCLLTALCVSGPELGVSSPQPAQQLCGVRTISPPVLPVRKQRHREVKELALGHTAKKWQSQRLFQVWLSLEHFLFFILCPYPSNQSIQREINPEYSLEGLMMKLKLQYFSHLMVRANSLEKTLILGKIEGRRRKG